VFKLLLLSFAGYGFICGYMFLKQDSLVFPTQEVFYEDPGPIENTQQEELALSMADGTVLKGTAYESTAPTEDLVISFAGNAQNAINFNAVLSRPFAGQFNSVGINYRGYWQSEGSPSEKKIYADALEIYDQMVEKYNPKRVFVFSMSLGTGVATYLSKHREVDGILLVTPFDSILNLAQAEYPYLPVKYILRHHFNSLLHLQDNTTPVAVIAGGNDPIIPPVHLGRLKQAVPNLVFAHTIPDGRHGSIVDHKEFNALLKQAFRAFSS